MLLLLADSLLLLFITMNLGILTRNMLAKGFRCTVAAGPLGIFLLGLIFSSIYFNILSFWWPVNYLSLIPLAALSSIVFLTNRDTIRSLQRSSLQHIKYFLAPARLPITICVLATLFVYWIIPPGNEDSTTYHYLSILWYEKYKVVPGLANINGRLAFNPVSFIIQAAYSFSGPAGQSLYPLNGVLMSLFSGWLLVRLFRAGPTLTGLVYTGLIVLLFRPLLFNISSPTSDTLVAVCIAYALVRIVEMAISDAPDDRQLSQALVPCVLLIYSLTAKLSSFAVLLALPLVFYWLPKKERSLSLLLKTSLIALFIYLPWLARNYILSGYLAYPIPSLGCWHPDWQAPRSLLRLDLFFIEVWPKTNGYEIALSTPLPLYRWFFNWYTYFSKVHSVGDPLLFTISILSPFYWFHLHKKGPKKATRPFLLWLALYAGIWLWLLTSPVVRFSSVQLCLSVAIPAFVFLYRRPQQPRAVYQWFIGLLFVISSIFYLRAALQKPTTYRFTLADCWLYPLKDKAYNNNEKIDFLNKNLSPGIKLYISDGWHQCINTCLPCLLNYINETPCYYDEIEMRGDRIDQGFRMVRDELPFQYPFIK